MKIKILRGDRGKWYHNTDNIGREFGVKEYYEYSLLRFNIKGGYRVDEDDCVITELPESFCVKRCDDNNRDDWNKYLQWLNKQKNYPIPMFGGVDRYKYYGVNGENLHSDYLYPFGTEIHIDDIIKHIDFYSEPMAIESKEEFDMSTNRGRRAYTIKYYPYGTEYRGLDLEGNVVNRVSKVNRTPYYNQYDNIDAGSDWIYIDKFNKWAEIINEVKEETKMETQKLSRQGLKEIHSVACGGWKEILEKYGTTNPLEDYIELTQEQVNTMFNSSTKEQLPIVSKYLKQDDGSIDVTKFKVSGKGFCDDDFYIIRDREWGVYKKQSFLLSEKYNWEIKTDEVGQLCLIPTKKK
jgi:hypothetical protein